MKLHCFSTRKSMSRTQWRTLPRSPKSSTNSENTNSAPKVQHIKMSLFISLIHVIKMSMFKFSKVLCLSVLKKKSLSCTRPWACLSPSTIFKRLSVASLKGELFHFIHFCRILHKTELTILFIYFFLFSFQCKDKCIQSLFALCSIGLLKKDKALISAVFKELDTIDDLKYKFDIIKLKSIYYCLEVSQI